MSKYAGLYIFYLVIAIGLAAGIYAYVNEGGTANSPAPAQGTPVLFTTLASGSQSTVTDRVNYLITTDAELGSLWALLRDSIQRPTVDFSKYDVLAVFAGTVPTAGYSIAITKISDTDHREVTIELDTPGVSCLAADTRSNPYEIIQVPKTDLPLTHTDVSQTISCLR